MELIKGNSTAQVWLAACQYLRPLRSQEDFDVILHVADPSPLSRQDAAVLKLVDDFLVSHGGLSLNTVAETIFPLQDYLRGGRHAVFEIYPTRMKRIHDARKDKQWGCYAMRILRQIDRDGTVFNPLEDLLTKIEKHKNYKAAFEIGLGHQPVDQDPEGDDIAIYDGAHDRRPLRGHLPCLMHLSIKIDRGRIRLNATYRSHYYTQRLLGNLMGLARLQYFLAHESGLGIGPITINSTYAKLDIGDDGRWQLRDIDQLLASSQDIYAKEEAA